MSDEAETTEGNRLGLALDVIGVAAAGREAPHEPGRRLRAALADLKLFGLLAGLGVLQFGWIAWPPLGDLWNLVNGGINVAILLCGLAAAAFRSARRRKPPGPAK